MSIIKWDPFKDLLTFREKMNRLFEETFSLRGEEGELFSGTWSPAVDIYETENEVVLTAELPGMNEKDIQLKIEDNNLVLRGERKFEKETKEENYHRIERAYGSFYRCFTIPPTVDRDKISAEYDNGILTVRMPKKAETKPKEIKISRKKSKE
ncbi:Hsp20/alpha crystallin family protein [Candidatus Aminicenantes bacterium AC-708-M15]|jgi:HSP20 family protein|nr:Hsp20/alpha crystallin family protein [SCandidatus Aminicenantes bacterium Aminicenantia_JdfR_composite]MCP2596811.1 Hsp20/alpha crystallin family protein [Candidatus Aminicenantes bacterium AC-335-G13]MCP2598272.1 Hsp20/alpha crystallin family protein [Candidatus Aminicenantes bacterium AC-335-L06]MCP2604011.1 Hsp20/alpha crystallin family protein [Candidatus Aminicenantes bacterium AC-708-M15]MCP2606502.1 Hsp20/alpha crystallin family protein [Candidatus Aminicenantes bacterium AC-708-I09]